MVVFSLPLDRIAQPIERPAARAMGLVSEPIDQEAAVGYKHNFVSSSGDM